jgi:hypothetical protein
MQTISLPGQRDSFSADTVVTRDTIVKESKRATIRVIIAPDVTEITLDKNRFLQLIRGSLCIETIVSASLKTIVTGDPI